MAVSLVTGATGFVGGHVARLLAERGDELRLTVRRGGEDQQLTVELGTRPAEAEQQPVVP